MATTPPYPNSYKQDALNAGWTDNGDGTLTGPDGTIMRPDDSPEANARYASLNKAAADALTGTKGSTDPYAMSNYERQHDPNFKNDFGEATKGWYTNPETGAFEDKPQSFFSKYGPWLALLAAGGVGAAGALGAFGGAGAAGAAGSGGAEAGAAGLLPSTTIGAGYIPAIAGGTGLAGAGAGAGAAEGAFDAAGNFTGPSTFTGSSGAGGAGTSLGSTLLKKLLTGSSGTGGTSLADILANASANTGKTLANNRGSALKGGIDIDNLAVRQNQDQRASEVDSLRKLAQTSYLKGGGAPYTPPTIPGIGQLPDFGFGPKAPSSAQVSGAGALQDTIMNRLNNPQPTGISLSDLTKLLTPSTGENVTNVTTPSIDVINQIIKDLQNS